MKPGLSLRLNMHSITERRQLQMQPNVNTQETLFFALQHGKHRISGSQRCMHISRRLSVMTDRQSV